MVVVAAVVAGMVGIRVSLLATVPALPLLEAEPGLVPCVGAAPVVVLAPADLAPVERPPLVVGVHKMLGLAAPVVLDAVLVAVELAAAVSVVSDMLLSCVAAAFDCVEGVRDLRL